MSYDIRIIKADDPYGDPVEPLDVKKLINAFNSFPAFAERGITWGSERWLEYEAWAGLYMFLEEHEPELNESGEENLEAGMADAYDMHISYSTDSDLFSCLALAVDIAAATGATAWDLQLDRPVDLSDLGPPASHWNRWRGWLASFISRLKS